METKCFQRFYESLLRLVEYLKNQNIYKVRYHENDFIFHNEYRNLSGDRTSQLKSHCYDIAPHIRSDCNCVRLGKHILIVTLETLFSN